MSNLKHIWYIALNNLRLFVTDRTAVIMFILFPFLFIIMFNLMLGNIGSQDPRLELHMATLESNGLSQQLIQSMETRDESQLKPGEPLIIWDKDYNQARTDVESGKLAGFMSFPADFTQNVQAGKNTSLEIVTQAEATNTRMALNGLAQEISAHIEAKIIEIKAVVALLAQQGSSPADIQKAIGQILQSQDSSSETVTLINYQTDKVGEVRPLNASSYVIPGYLVMFVFLAAAVGSVDIIRERRTHTLERLLASSVKKESILTGIFLGGVFRGLVQIIIFWGMGVLVFHVDLGVAPWAVIVISLLMVIMSAAFSILLATLTKTERSSSALAILFSLLLAPLGGCWWPLFIEPKWMQFLAKFTPHGWANQGFNKLMLFGATGSDVRWEMVALVGFTVLFFIIGLVKFSTSADAT
jgi:ABC-2 type transport system permease protein